MGTLTKKPQKAENQSTINVSDHDTTLPSKIRYFTRGRWGSNFYKNICFYKNMTVNVNPVAGI